MGRASGAQDDYAQSFDTIVEQLRAAGVPGITKNGQITEAALRDPRFADALRPTIQPFRDAPKATIEVGTTQTPFGAEAAKVAAQLRERIAETNDPKDVKISPSIQISIHLPCTMLRVAKTRSSRRIIM